MYDSYLPQKMDYQRVIFTPLLSLKSISFAIFNPEGTSVQRLTYVVLHKLKLIICAQYISKISDAPFKRMDAPDCMPKYC